VEPAVFLDRDDTLIECRGLPAPPPPAAPGDIVDASLVRLLPGALEACELLAGAGLALVIVSNQGVVARGGATVAEVERINERVRSLLTVGGRPLIRAAYFCPFHPKGRVPEFSREHPWRKPAPGMIHAAAEELGLDLSRSWLVGDAPRDVEAGVNAGQVPVDR
jgi:D-glycero-D-manno-heptose 1,7-bisphosphate phosphatase